MKTGFTVVEVLVVITIIIILISMGVAVTHSMKYGVDENDFDYSYINPQFETARQQRRIAEELKRQNDLMEKRMNDEKSFYNMEPNK